MQRSSDKIVRSNDLQQGGPGRIHSIRQLLSNRKKVKLAVLSAMAGFLAPTAASSIQGCVLDRSGEALFGPGPDAGVDSDIPDTNGEDVTTDSDSCVPETEICDGVDNNCNDEIDEDDPQLGEACDTGLSGICSAGTKSCENGGIVCTQTNQPETEVCDGVDNDCNDQTDEDDPQLGDACDTGLLGICADGEQVCNSGQLECEQSVQSSAEICNDNLDNDCDDKEDCVDDQCMGDTACDVDIDVTINGDNCHKAVHFLADDSIVVSESTADSHVCSQGDVVGVYDKGDRAQLWENNDTVTFTSDAAPVVVEFRCSPFTNPPDHTNSLSALNGIGYTTIGYNVNGQIYTVNLNGCSEYDVRVGF